MIGTFGETSCESAPVTNRLAFFAAGIAIALPGVAAASTLPATGRNHAGRECGIPSGIRTESNCGVLGGSVTLSRVVRPIGPEAPADSHSIQSHEVEPRCRDHTHAQLRYALWETQSPQSVGLEDCPARRGPNFPQ